MAGFPASKVRSFVALYRKRKKAEAQLQAMKDRLGALESELAEAFAQAGMQNINVDGATVYLNRQIWASVASGSSEALAEAMKSVGLSDLVKTAVNASQLSAYVRELPRDTNDMPVLPAALAGLVNVRDVVRVRVNEG